MLFVFYYFCNSLYILFTILGRMEMVFLVLSEKGAFDYQIRRSVREDGNNNPPPYAPPPPLKRPGEDAPGPAPKR